MTVTAEQAIETFGTASEENNRDHFRNEQVIELPAEGEVWMTGDIHDHRRNFEKLIRYADLGNNPQRHLILHELIHGEHYDADGVEDSWKTLFQAATLKCDYPDQVHFLLANHDLAQIHGEGIMKDGQSVCEAFTAGLKRDFGSPYHRVNVAISEFFLSLPLGIRCANGMFFCHSMPTDAQMDAFDFSIFDRPLSGADYKRRVGPVYQLIWGRNITPAGVDKFLEKVGATMVITGHQPQDNGFLVNGEKHLIIASNHNQGVFLPIELQYTYTMDQLVESLQKFVGLE